MPRAWNHLATPMGKWKRGWPLFFAYAEGKHREDGRKQMELMEFITEHDDELPDGLLAESAISQSIKRAGRKFFNGLGLL